MRLLSTLNEKWGEIMGDKRFTRVSGKTYLTILAGVLIMVGLIWSSQYHYLLFHTLAEGFSIAVAGAIFIIAWNTWDFSENGYLQFLGITLLFIAGLDAVHTLAYKGMGVFAEYDANLPTQLWTAARYLESLSFLIAPIFLTRKPRRYGTFGVYLGVSVVLLVLAFTRLFPVCYVEGVGLTQFKVASEYVISFLLVVAIWRLFRQRAAFSSEVFPWLVAALVFTIVSELAFTFYVGVYDVSNLVGHIFKIFSFYCIYHAVVRVGLRQPYALLFRGLEQRNEQLQQEVAERERAEQVLRAQTDALGRSEARFRRQFESTPIPTFIWKYDQETFHLIDYNAAVESLTRGAVEAFVGLSVDQIYPDRLDLVDNFHTCLKEKSTITYKTKYHTRGTDLDRIIVFTYVYVSPDLIMLHSEDITERIQMEQTLRESEERYRAVSELTSDYAYAADIGADGAYNLEWATKPLETFTGYNQDEMEALGGWRELIYPDDKPMVHQHFQALLSGEPNVAEFRIQTKNGGIRWLHNYGRPTGDGGEGHFTRIIGASQDITERKRAEEALHQYVGRLKIQHEIDTAILEARSPEAIGRVALQHLYNLIPYQRASVTEIDWERQRGRDIVVLVGQEVEPLHPEWHPTTNTGLLIETIRLGQTYHIDDITLLVSPSPLENVLARQGMRAYISVPMMVQGVLLGTLNLAKATPGLFKHDQIEILEGVAASLAVAIQQANLLETAEHDAETRALLLREVNHRVKNNLDAIIGLLYVEQRHAPPEALPAYRPIMEDLTSRVMGLATVHRLLSETEWRPLLLSELMMHIIQTTAQTVSHEARLMLDVAPASIRVTASQAHHLALIIGELTTNTFKYAVVDDKVRVTVRMRQEGEIVTFTYHNDGPNFPDDVVSLKRHNAGLDIIQKIVRRSLKGGLSLRNEGGALTEIWFPVDKVEFQEELYNARP